MENSEDIIQKSGCSLLGELVVYKRLQMGKFLCVLDSWSLMGGGRPV